jgi:hypothetical protein
MEDPKSPLLEEIEATIATLKQQVAALPDNAYRHHAAAHTDAALIWAKQSISEADGESQRG